MPPPGRLHVREGDADSAGRRFICGQRITGARSVKGHTGPCVQCGTNLARRVLGNANADVIRALNAFASLPATWAPATQPRVDRDLRDMRAILALAGDRGEAWQLGAWQGRNGLTQLHGLRTTSNGRLCTLCAATSPTAAIELSQHTGGCPKCALLIAGQPPRSFAADVQRPIREILETQVQRLYEDDGWSAGAIGRAIGRDRNTILIWLRHRGVVIRRPGADQRAADHHDARRPAAIRSVRAAAEQEPDGGPQTGAAYVRCAEADSRLLSLAEIQASLGESDWLTILRLAGLDDLARRAARTRAAAAGQDTRRLEETVRAHREHWEGAPAHRVASRLGISEPTLMRRYAAAGLIRPTADDALTRDQRVTTAFAQAGDRGEDPARVRVRLARHLRNQPRREWVTAMREHALNAIAGTLALANAPENALSEEHYEQLRRRKLRPPHAEILARAPWPRAALLSTFLGTTTWPQVVREGEQRLAAVEEAPHA